MHNQEIAPRTEPRVSRIPPIRRAVAAGEMPRVPLIILYRGQIVGTTRLEFPLDAPHAIGGRLTPGPALNQAWEAFRLYEDARAGDHEAMGRFVRARDALELALVDRDGRAVAGRVDLISRWEDDRWIVHLSLS